MDDNQDLNEILQVRRDKLRHLRERGADPYLITRYKPTYFSQNIVNDYEKMEGKRVTVAGRMVAKRVMGKASFAHIQDNRGRIQIYLQVNALGEEAYTEFKSWDIGDIIGVAGEVFKTHKGEVSVRAEKITLLSKSLQPLPEKWHGLTDPDLRYRQRYLDLIVNPEVKETFVLRSRILRSIRKFLDKRGYLEVETPVLHVEPDNADSRPFVTHHNTLDVDMFLRIELELKLKRLIVGGFDRVYEIGRIFRNEGMSVKHNPEFTMIELYQAYADYHDMMEIAEEMISHAAKDVLGTMRVTYQGEVIELKPPWARMSMAEAVRKYAGVDFDTIETDEQARAIARNKGVEIEKDMTKGHVLNAIFEARVEDHLVQPTFIYDYPVEISPLAKRKKDDPAFTERFEIFITRREIGNAFSELNDPIDQRARFEKQAQKKHGDATRYDTDFIDALEIGLPPTGGMGIGVDRVVMLLTDSRSIRDVILFPTMKPKD
jgi:lysyl-tRNA synthetase class 2